MLKLLFRNIVFLLILSLIGDTSLAAGFSTTPRRLNPSVRIWNEQALAAEELTSRHTVLEPVPSWKMAEEAAKLLAVLQAKSVEGSATAEDVVGWHQEFKAGTLAPMDYVGRLFRTMRLAGDLAVRELASQFYVPFRQSPAGHMEAMDRSKSSTLEIFVDHKIQGSASQGVIQKTLSENGRPGRYAIFVGREMRWSRDADQIVLWVSPEALQSPKVFENQLLVLLDSNRNAPYYQETVVDDLPEWPSIKPDLRRQQTDAILIPLFSAIEDSLLKLNQTNNAHDFYEALKQLNEAMGWPGRSLDNFLGAFEKQTELRSAHWRSSQWILFGRTVILQLSKESLLRRGWVAEVRLDGSWRATRVRTYQIVPYQKREALLLDVDGSGGFIPSKGGEGLCSGDYVYVDSRAIKRQGQALYYQYQKAKPTSDLWAEVFSSRLQHLSKQEVIELQREFALREEWRHFKNFETTFALVFGPPEPVATVMMKILNPRNNNPLLFETFIVAAEEDPEMVSQENWRLAIGIANETDALIEHLFNASSIDYLVSTLIQIVSRAGTSDLFHNVASRTLYRSLGYLLVSIDPSIALPGEFELASAFEKLVVQAVPDVLWNQIKFLRDRMGSREPLEEEELIDETVDSAARGILGKPLAFIYDGLRRRGVSEENIQIMAAPILQTLLFQGLFFGLPLKLAQMYGWQIDTLFWVLGCLSIVSAAIYGSKLIHPYVYVRDTRRKATLQDWLWLSLRDLAKSAGMLLILRDAYSWGINPLDHVFLRSDPYTVRELAWSLYRGLLLGTFMSMFFHGTLNYLSRIAGRISGTATVFFAPYFSDFPVIFSKRNRHKSKTGARTEQGTSRSSFGKWRGPKFWGVLALLVASIAGLTTWMDRGTTAKPPVPTEISSPVTSSVEQQIKDRMVMAAQKAIVQIQNGALQNSSDRDEILSLFKNFVASPRILPMEEKEIELGTYMLVNASDGGAIRVNYDLFMGADPAPLDAYLGAVMTHELSHATKRQKSRSQKNQAYIDEGTQNPNAIFEDTPWGTRQRDHFKRSVALSSRNELEAYENEVMDYDPTLASSVGLSFEAYLAQQAETQPYFNLFIRNRRPDGTLNRDAVMVDLVMEGHSAVPERQVGLLALAQKEGIISEQMLNQGLLALRRKEAPLKVLGSQETKFRAWLRKWLTKPAYYEVSTQEPKASLVSPRENPALRQAA